MPWDIKKDGDKYCVVKATTGEVKHCYSGPGAAKKAGKYLYALRLHAGKELDPDNPEVFIKKEADGRYLITTVSTAAVQDLDKETFETRAIDWDMKEAERLNDYPEYRMFHKKFLAIGKVEKMMRVGIFAVDQGHSYDDPFSKEICEKILATNNGKWRCSRGFYVKEASGGCPNCGQDLVITKEHMVAGFRCPSCKTVHMSYKGVLKDLHFRKARTFDVTITDIPCVPYTGVTAVKLENTMEAKEMLTKEQLKKKLLDAGVSEDVVEAKLSKISDAQLKELEDIPEATLLKEIVDEPDDTDAEEDVDATAEEDSDEVDETEEEDKEAGEETFVLDTSVLKEFAKIVDQKIKEALDGLEIDVETPLEKETGTLVELKEALGDVSEKLDKLIELFSKTDKERLKEILTEAPRNGKLRVMRFKTQPDPDEEVEDEDDESEEPVMGNVIRSKEKAVIRGADGEEVNSMTEFVMGKH